jgi:hypothetical protein
MPWGPPREVINEINICLNVGSYSIVSEGSISDPIGDPVEGDPIARMREKLLRAECGGRPEHTVAAVGDTDRNVVRGPA